MGRLHDRPQGVHKNMIDPDGTSAFDAIQHWEKFIEVNARTACAPLTFLIFPERSSVLVKQAIYIFVMGLWYMHQFLPCC